VTCDETEEDTESCKTLRCEELKVYFMLDDAIASKFFFFCREPYVRKLCENIDY